MTSQYNSINNNRFKVKTASSVGNLNTVGNNLSNDNKLSSSNKFLNNDEKSGLKLPNDKLPSFAKPKVLGNNSRIQSLISKLAENQKDTPFPPKKFVTVKEKLKAEADKVNAEKSKSTSPKESPPKELSPKETPVKELLLKESQPRKSPSPKESISKLIEIKKTIKEQSPTKENILVIHTIVSLSPDRELYSKENLAKENKTKEKHPEIVTSYKPYYASSPYKTKNHSPIRAPSPVKEHTLKSNTPERVTTPPTPELAPERTPPPLKKNPFFEDYYRKKYGYDENNEDVQLTNNEQEIADIEAEIDKGQMTEYSVITPPIVYDVKVESLGQDENMINNSNEIKRISPKPQKYNSHYTSDLNDIKKDDIIQKYSKTEQTNSNEHIQTKTYEDIAIEEETVGTYNRTALAKSEYYSMKTQTDDKNDLLIELNKYRVKLADTDDFNKQLRIENKTLQEELYEIRHEMEELQDQFRMDDADEFRQLQAELEIAAKNCRILQFKLRKIEKRNETLETDKIVLQEKIENSNRDNGKICDLEEELLIAKEVSIRLHNELEQAQRSREKSENLNRELKKQLDDLKDHLDNEIKNRSKETDNNELVLANSLYESMFREYFMQEQLYSISSTSHNENVNRRLREVTDLLGSYHTKITIYGEEIAMLKQQISYKDREMDTMRLQLKNLKRSKSSDRDFKRQIAYTNSQSDIAEENNESPEKNKAIFEISDTLTRQAEINHDEVRLLKNKISRLEDDLLYVTQERDNLSAQLENIENKAMKSFSMSVENDIVAIDADEAGEAEVNSDVIKQMNKLMKKNDQLKNEVQQTELSKTQLSADLKNFKTKLDDTIDSSKKSASLKQEEIDAADDLMNRNKLDKQEIETIKNLTDADKLLRDENKLLKTDLEDKTQKLDKVIVEMDKNQIIVNQLKELIANKDNQLETITAKEKYLYNQLDESTKNISELKKQIEFNEINLEKLKADLNEKNKMEKNLIGDSENLNEKLFELSKNLGSKIDEINILNQKYKILQEKTVSDSFKMHTLEEDINFHKAQISSLNKDIDAKNIEIRKLEASLKSQETDLKRIDSKFTTVDKTVRSKFEEVNNGRQALFELQNKFDKLTDDTDAKVNTMSREIERLSGEKTKLKQAFDNLNIIHEKCIAGRGEQSEKVVMKKLESQVLTAKYESKVQYLEIEIDTLRSKVRKLLKEKEVHDHINKENQLLVKEIAHKYQTDSDNWNRQRQKLLEKEKLYEESVDMRKELKKAADKLRQKLQSLEDQIIDKQNKHTIEKNSWETQRMQYVSAINRLEEQHGKSSTLKKFSKKEAEIVWEKERTELSTHVVNLEAFIKDLQSQLCQRNQNTNQTMTNDQYTQNEKIQSLFGENEFLKNRIRELEIMLEEMEQVKRFLYDVKEAYDADRLEWNLTKEEFRYQLELKENLWIEANMRLNKIIEVIQLVQSNEPLPENLTSLAKDSVVDLKEGSEINVVNSLVGSTSNLLEQKFTSSQRSMAFKEMGIRHNSLQNQLLERQYSRNLSPSKMNLSNLKPINEQQPHQGQDGNSFIDGTSNKELNVDFEQAFKKMNRVKDNFSTHKKFMDIVKSKSMKALNRKSSSSSLSSHNINQQADLFPLNLPHESRCSVPPDYRSGSVTAPRAKSMSKEPLLTRENSTASQKSSNSSVFHSLSRRIAKFRSSSTQPRNDKDYSIDDPDYDSNTDLANINEKARSMSKQISQVSQVSHDESHLESDSVTQADLDQEKKSKDRTLSPKKLLKGLRARSPFARKQTSNSDLQKASSLNPTTTTMVSGSKVRSFTVGSNELDKSDSASSANGISRQIRATTAGPTLKPTNSVTSADSQLKSNRSASYEFIDKHQNDSPHNLNNLNETLDEDDESINDASSHMQPPEMIGEEERNRRARRMLNMSSFNTSQSSNITQISNISKFNKNYDAVSNSSHDVVKSVKFKEPDQYQTSPQSSPSKVSNISNIKTQELKLLEVLDKAMVSTPNSMSEKNEPAASDKKLNPNSKFKSAISFGGNGSTQSVDKPPKAPSGANLTNAFGLRSKLSGLRSKTMDIYDSHRSNETENTGSNASSENINQNTPILNSTGKPIQSILRRSETPPVGKTLKSQVSLESHRSYREESIEKIMNASSSTSRPLMRPLKGEQPN